MSDNHARALAQEAGLVWLEGHRDAAGIVGETTEHDLFTRAIVLDAFAAGAADREDKIAALKEALWAGCELLIEAAVRFREYETHHRAKLEDPDDFATFAGRDAALDRNAPTLAKAERNAEIAGRIETWLAASVVIPHPIIGLALSLCQDLNELIESSEGVTGLHRNGDVAPWDSLTEGGAFESWLGSFDRLKAALDQMPDAALPRPSINPADALRHVAELVGDDLGLEVDHASFDQGAAYLDELVLVPADEGVPIPVIERTIVRPRPLPAYLGPHGDEEPLRRSNVRDPSAPGLMDPEVVEGLLAAAGGGEPGARSRPSMSMILPDTREAAFIITTPDPDFSPALPVMVNGYLFYPAPRAN